MKINEIKPYEKNAKKHSKKQVQQIANSIKEFGFNQPIVIDNNNVVIVGHGRLEAGKLLGLQDVPVLKVDLTEDQAKAYRLADNKLNESDWEMDLVIEEIKDLDDELKEIIGFNEEDMSMFEPASIEEQGKLDELKTVELSDIMKIIERYARQEGLSPFDVINDLSKTTA